MPIRHLASLLLLLVLVACSSAGPDVESTAAPEAPVQVDTTTTTTTTSPTTTTTTTTTPPPSIEECLAEIPLEVKVGQLLFPVMTQSEFGTATVLAASGHIAGVVVLGSPDSRVTRDIEAMQATSLVGPSIIAVDEEGGRVQRLEQLVGSLPSARAMAASDTPAELRARSRAHAEAIGALGFTMNLAPVLDLDNGVYIRDRSFGADPQTVIDHGFAFADGILDAGLLATAKHFPGHGRGTDSHTGLPSLPPLDELRATDLVPFVAAVERRDLPIMIGHLVIPGLTDGEPATLSPAAISGLLRGELGFEGLVMTDALNMDAISVQRSNDEAAELAITAGVDLAMLGRIDDVEPTIARLLEAVENERLPVERIDESFLRVLDAKGVAVCDLPADVAPAIACNGVSSGACAQFGG